MALNSITSRAASALPLVAIGLALANWYVRPAAAWGWAAAVVMCAVMIAVRYRFQLVLRRSSGDAASVRSLDHVTRAVVVGALTMIMPLAATLATTYGLVDDPDSGRRMTMIIVGAYLAMIGNAMPRQLPPVSSMQCNGARLQAFQRLAGWTWALAGVGFSMAWLALPLDAAQPVSMTMIVAAMIVTIVQIVRLRKPRQHAAGLN
jgi:hypothetical protein